ncbi:MAG: HAMP domain-containing histidine kinase [Thermoleophilia bacterium]|nr:HAMP domain-containing histidine kinase [Thermoleophilia bacterium]
MRRGLRLKLALTHAGVAALAVVVVALIVNYTGERRFERYVDEVREQRQSAVVRILAETYRAGGWDAQAIYAVGQIASFNNVDVAVYDPDGGLLFTVEGRRAAGMGRGMMGQGGMSETERSSTRSEDGVEVTSYPIEVDGDTVGRADVYAVPAAEIAVDESFRSALNRNLLLAAAVAAVLALLVSVVITRRITGPLEELTDAAEEVAAGNLEVRVAPRSDDEVGALAAAFNQMADALARDEQWRRDMTADLAHELRTPLATIQARIEALEDGVLPATPENLRVIGEEVERLGRLLGDLRSLNEMEAEDFELVLERLDLGDVVGDALTRAEPAYARAGVAIERELAPASVSGDHDRLLQVLGNLLENARKFTPAGGRVVVTVASGGAPPGRAPGGWSRLTIADSGPGIAAVDLPFVFDRFYRSSDARSTAGVGLGLAIAKGLVEAHGGVIEAGTAPEGGALFTVWLPSPA